MPHELEIQLTSVMVHSHIHHPIDKNLNSFSVCSVFNFSEQNIKYLMGEKDCYIISKTNPEQDFFGFQFYKLSG